MNPNDIPTTRVGVGLYEEALRRWGGPAQIGMFHEEVGEVLQALNKYQRRPDDMHRRLLLAEMADLKVMLEQMVVLFDKDGTFDNEYVAKIGALAVRLGCADGAT